MLVLALLLNVLTCGDVHVDEVRGFSIEVPEGWTTAEQDVPERGHVLSLLPPASVGEVAVSVAISDLALGTEAEALRRAALERIAEKADEFSEPELWVGELCGAEAPGLRVDFSSPRGEYHIVQSYQVSGARGFTVQWHAPVDEFEAMEESLEAVVRTLTWVEVTEEGREQERLAQLAARCGGELDWAESWEDAARRARKEKKLVLCCASFLSGFSISNTQRTTTFTDEDIVDLVGARFVPLWLQKGMSTPLDETYGLGPSSFGQALLVVTPEGEVVLETHENDPDVAHAFLLAALERRPEAEGEPIPSGLEPLERARLLLARGELEAAEQQLSALDSGAAHRLRARLHALRRDGKGALEALLAARAFGDEPEAALLTEEALLLLRERRTDEARAALDRVLEEFPGAEDLPKALLLRGLVDLVDRDREAAQERWRGLVRAHPESRYAWQAAAALSGPLLSIDARPDLGWPDPELFTELLAFPERDVLPPSRAREAAVGAVRWLLEHQREDGSWLSPTQLNPSPDLGPDPFTDSITALATRALLRRGGAEARAAASRGVDYLLDSIARREVTPPMVLFMDYMTWSDAMMLEALADALDSGVGDEARLRAAGEVLTRDLARRQVPGQGWSYYVTNNLEGDGAPSQSISFTTAGCVLALARARDVGFEGPEHLLVEGVAALEAMRDADGVFSYFLYSDSGVASRSTGVAGAVGRGPACELALARAGRSSSERLGRALELFLAQAHLYSAEQGKVVMHAGPDAQGCHYLFFDYAHAALVQEALPADRRVRAHLLELILGARQPDGSFVDSPILGRAYGTSMALIGLDALGA